MCNFRHFSFVFTDNLFCLSLSLSGKSSASRVLSKLGAIILDFDLMSREVVLPGNPAWLSIKRPFGDLVLNDDDGTLNRAKLGDICFADRAQLRKLNALMRGPLLRLFFSKLFAAFFHQRSGLVILDAPLLFETPLHLVCSTTLMIRVSAETQLRRLITRDHLSDAQARQRMQSQKPPSELAQKADTVIENEGSLEQLESHITQWWRQQLDATHSPSLLSRFCPNTLSWFCGLVFACGASFLRIFFL